MVAREPEEDEPYAAQAARIREAFEERYRTLAPFAEERALASEVATEAGPAIHALVFAGESREADELALSHHESLAMTQLLGRRVAELGATPTTATALVPELLRLVRAEVPVPERLDRQLVSVFAEGYARGREDRLTTEATQARVEAAPIVLVAERCYALFIRGPLEADAVTELTERFGRVLFKADARAAIVDVAGFPDDDERPVFAALTVDETAKMLGARCVFVGDHPVLRSQEHADRVDRFSDALDLALHHLGLAIKSMSWFRRRTPSTTE